MARNWLLVVVALERLLFFLRPIDFVQLWTPAMVTAAVAVVMVSVLLSHGYRQRLIYMLRLQRFRWFRAHGDGGVERMQDTTGGVGNTERGERRDRNDRSGDDAEQ
ncbi:hypothetical protein EGR_09959 [Echinococcus granulosus]|uniref:Uncharacterized protein n=1 Tax=Echinococcus granulosus TaxID=6210 RepID=W6U9K4_ECHGR|nr:hypothetical protein EGR_09959 [Echinococcus granulosus]EUB55177.1 hypothetical protein EGR_09959 [Echinococcus granulosus]